MALISAHTFLNYVKDYRVLWLSGRYGGGKTALSYRIAYELVAFYGFRYILSNIKSVWDDRFEDVVLRDGVYADAVVILDEGGLFLETSRDAKAFLAFLRKLNIVLVVPSVTPPASKLQFLSVQRVMDISRIFPLPIWAYRFDLVSGHIRETEMFYWWRPSEIFGVYDTLAFPEDDGGLGRYFNEWTKLAQAHTGYKTGTALSDNRSASDTVSQAQAGTTAAFTAELLAELRWAAGAFSDAGETISNSVSLSQSSRGKGRKKGR